MKKRMHQCSFVLMLILGSAMGAETKIDFRISIDPPFVRSLTGRSEGLFAKAQQKTDVMLLITEGTNNVLTSPLWRALLGYSEENLVSVNAKRGGVIVLWLEIAGGREGRHRLGEVKIADAPVQNVQIVCDRRTGVTIASQLMEASVRSESVSTHATAERTDSVAIDPYTRLKKLKELFDSGIITTNEYNTNREALVKEL